MTAQEVIDEWGDNSLEHEAYHILDQHGVKATKALIEDLCTWASDYADFAARETRERDEA